MFKKVVHKIHYNLLSPMPAERKSRRIKDRIRKVRYILFGNLPFLGRKRSYGETHKAEERRIRESFFDRYCKGIGLDIGYGGDPLVTNVTGWDFEHGDAQLLNGIEDEYYDFVYSSHLLEHMLDVKRSLRNWWRVLKPGGYLILYLPHRDLYEKKARLPSRFNDDHKHFFLPDVDELPDTIGIIPLLERTLDTYEVIYCKICDEGFTDPGQDLQSTGEYSIEVVIKKLLI